MNMFLCCPLTIDIWHTSAALSVSLRSRILMNSVLTFQFCVALCYKHGQLWLLQHVLSRAHLEIWRNTNKHNFFNSSSASEIFRDIDLCVFNIAACKKWDVLGNKIGGKHSERSENSSRTASCVFFASQTNYQALFTQTQGKLSFIQNLGSNFLTWGTESLLLVTFLQAFNLISCRVNYCMKDFYLTESAEWQYDSMIVWQSW